MRMTKSLLILPVAALLFACNSQTGEQASTPEAEPETVETEEFQNEAEQFADLRLLRYEVPGFDQLTLDQKKLAYYLYEAGLSGRDMIWDQNYRHNLAIRGALENIVKNFAGNRDSEDWQAFLTYTKRVWFANGIHHHYSMDKFTPEFSRDYLSHLMMDTQTTLDESIIDIMFDPEMDNKRVNLDTEKGLIKGSANNFYDPDITEEEVDAYYAKVIDKNDKTPISYGLNSKMVRKDGELYEEVYKIDGLYGAAIAEVVSWLEKAVGVAENAEQKKALELLVEYYKTGDLKTWDEYNIAWVADVNSVVDAINGFIEVYGDAKGFRGTYESVVQIKDFDASARMQTLSENVQWFEDNSSIMEEHKKANVKGVTYKVITVAGESGDASPSTPIGINLPNANWIRAEHGSKSVSLGNIVAAYDGASGSGFLEEFCYTEEEVARAKEHGQLASKLHTALHEVVGHASGQLEEGVGTPKETLKNYSSTLEEGRADLVALYFLMDEKMIDLGLMESLEVGKSEYDSYIRNGLMVQMRRLEPGAVIEEAHMRNRQLVAAWCYEKGKEENVIERIEKDGNTYFVVNDYMKLKGLFGDLLREIQRIKSKGDYEAGRALVEDYGVQVDTDLHAQVLERAEKLNVAPYSGFINPRLVPVMDGENITDVKVEYPDDFTEQMLEYSDKYGFLAPVQAAAE